LPDRLLGEGILVARTYSGQDRLDPARPTLARIVADALAVAEERGGQQYRDRIEALIAQRTALRDERLGVARRFLDEGNLQPAAAEFSWASALDEQLGALRLLLAPDEPS
jgi:hypothetical protein